jgi:hypothetical protein
MYSNTDKLSVINTYRPFFIASVLSIISRIWLIGWMITFSLSTISGSTLMAACRWGPAVKLRLSDISAELTSQRPVGMKQQQQQQQQIIKIMLTFILLEFLLRETVIGQRPKKLVKM